MAGGRAMQLVAGRARSAGISSRKCTSIASREGHSAEARYQFHQTEQWRDRLLSEPAALAEYIDQHPDVDRQALRHVVKKAQKAETDQQIKTESRALFRFLREQQDQA